MSLRMPLILVLVLFAATFGFGNPPYGQSADLTFGNWKLWCKIAIPGVTADGKFVTGTNVLATCSVGNSGPSGEEPVYRFMQLRWAKLEVAGSSPNGAVTLSKAWTYPDRDNPSPVPGVLQGGGGAQGVEGNPPHIRFASTKFSHLSEITLTLTVRFRGWIEEPGGLTPVDSGPISVTIKPKAYNFFLGWVAKKNSGGQYWPGPVQTIINATQYAINNMFVGFANHGYESSNPGYPELYRLKPNLMGLLDEATAVGANTHGYFLGLGDSETPIGAGMPGNGFISWPEINSLVNNRSETPGIPNGCNLVLLYACDTLIILDPAASFGAATSSRATAGFSRQVWTHGFTTEGELFTLDKHVLALRGMLNIGRTLGDSLTRVHAKYRPGRFLYDAQGNVDLESYEESLMSVSVSSDAKATLMHVYLTQEERASLHSSADNKFADWYWILGAPSLPDP